MIRVYEPASGDVFSATSYNAQTGAILSLLSAGLTTLNLHPSAGIRATQIADRYYSWTVGGYVVPLNQGANWDGDAVATPFNIPEQGHATRTWFEVPAEIELGQPCWLASVRAKAKAVAVGSDGVSLPRIGVWKGALGGAASILGGGYLTLASDEWKRLGADTPFAARVVDLQRDDVISITIDATVAGALATTPTVRGLQVWMTFMAQLMGG